MTALIEKQLAGMGLMLCGGLTAGLLYTSFRLAADFLRKTSRQEAFGNAGKNDRPRGLLTALEMAAEGGILFLTGWCVSIFLYYSYEGEITLAGILSFLAGLGIWKKYGDIGIEDTRDTNKGEKEYGKEGKPTAGIREESPGAGYFRRTKGTAGKKERKKSAGNGKQP